MLLCSMPAFCFLYLMLSIAYIYHFHIMLHSNKPKVSSP